jgi:hypothetical protein
MLLALALLAQIEAKDLPDPQSWMTMGWIIAGIFGIVGLANQGLQLWEKLFPKEKPPASEKYATKEELKAAIASIEAEHELQISRLEDDIDRDMTRIEGRFEQWIKQVELLHKEEMGQQRQFFAAIQEWQLKIERAIGHVEVKADQHKTGK